MRLTAAAILVLLAAAPGANAAVTVLGNGLAHDCYIAASHDYGARAGEETCTLALQYEPLMTRDRAATLVNRGVIRVGLHRYDDALSDYERAIAMGDRLSPSDLGIAWVDRASLLNALGRYREANDSASKGIALGTSKPEIAHYVRAIAEESLGDLKAAYLDYKQALALVPDFAPAAEELKRFHVETRPAGGT